MMGNDFPTADGGGGRRSDLPAGRQSRQNNVKGGASLPVFRGFGGELNHQECSSKAGKGSTEVLELLPWPSRRVQLAGVEAFKSLMGTIAGATSSLDSWMESTQKNLVKLVEASIEAFGHWMKLRQTLTEVEEDE